MATQTIEQRVSVLEDKLHEIEERLTTQSSNEQPLKRGWRWFVGIYGNAPEFDEVERIGREWRSAETTNFDINARE
jgi:hypothetical protein